MFYTSYQTKGRGLGENTWESEKNKNLLFSLLVFPEIKIERHFSLNMIISLAICDYLNLKGVLAKIKWPNDIYVNNDKIAGILVENSLYGDIIKSSVIGIGLNLNQTKFSKNIKNPISLKTLVNREFDIKDELVELGSILSNKIAEYKSKSFDNIKEEYLSKLFRYKKYFSFKYGNSTYEGQIIDIKKDGHILICDKQQNQKEFYFKEVEYIL